MLTQLFLCCGTIGEGTAISNCKLCAFLQNWLTDGRGSPCGELEVESDHWDRAHSNEAELLAQEPDHDRLEEAASIFKSDPQIGFRAYLDLAEKGSVFSMIWVAWIYGYGQGKPVASDDVLAGAWYRRAIEAGSWMATRHYGRFLAKNGDFAYCEAILGDGVKKGWVPAYFWLAHYRLKQSKSRKTYREIEPLLEYAAERGHPWAQHLLAAFMVRGKFGLRKIPHGFRLARAGFKACMAEAERRRNLIHPKPAEAGTQDT